MMRLFRYLFMPKKVTPAQKLLAMHLVKTNQMVLR